MRSPLAPVLLLLLAPFGARAANLDVSPVRIELSAQAPSAILTLRNTGTTPLRFQVKVHGWDESPSGSMILSDVSDLSVFPALQQIGPKEERKVRIGTTAKAGERERTWRVFVEEIPSAVEADDKNRVRIVTRIGIPVFLEPARPSPGGTLALARSGGKLELRVRNGGSVRIQPSELKVVLLDGAERPIGEKVLAGWYVLAGGERIWSVDVEPGLCASLRRVLVTATLEKGALQAALALPDGACAP